MGLLAWSLVFLVLAIIAAVFGFGSLARGAAGIAKLLLFLFVVVFIVLLVMSFFSGAAVRV